MTATATAATPTTIKPGTRLRNGATILQSAHVQTTHYGDATQQVSQHIVLALFGSEFVTWTLFVRDDLLARGLAVNETLEDGTSVAESTWGHYHHDDLARAVAEFAERVAERIG